MLSLITKQQHHNSSRVEFHKNIYKCTPCSWLVLNLFHGWGITLCCWLRKVLAHISVNPHLKPARRNWLCKPNLGSNLENKSLDFLLGSDLVSIKYVCMRVCSSKLFCWIPCAPYWISFSSFSFSFPAWLCFHTSLFCCCRENGASEKRRAQQFFSCLASG